MKIPLAKMRETQPVKFVYSARIDFGQNHRKRVGTESDSLEPGGSYYIGKNEQKITYEALRDFVTGVIESDLPDICNMYMDAPISIKVSGKYDGSLIVVFSAVFSAIQFISGLKDVYDVAKLIRDLAEERIKNRLSKEYGDTFNVWVSQRLPEERNRDYERFYLKEGRFPFTVSEQTPKRRRDAFFWYLLIANIVLFGIIILLVINAVVQVYL